MTEKPRDLNVRPASGQPVGALMIAILHGRGLSAVTLSITTTKNGQDSDGLCIKTAVVPNSCWNHLLLYYIYYILWLTLIRWWVEEVNYTSSSLSGSVHLQYVAFILVQGRLAPVLDVCISSSFSPSELSVFQLVARASFFVLLTVARRNWSRRHVWYITGRYISTT